MLDLVLGLGCWHGVILPRLDLHTQLNPKAAVRIVLGFVPHLEVANFVSRLLRVALFVYLMCFFVA